ncbi:AAA family ATPase [Fulvivirgaceae bacterium PWU4]|uniref:AAA family ATPase n=1 Tax=Chryseosolibacter histidini TaxID=2782349 RepID=A0AAP2DQS4_9BACT|nr:AAA family ATPase [Chryseosolibacter histidini]MBT1699628.1 AAA family ATPase [Chryseosolibacter histidini]
MSYDLQDSWDLSRLEGDFASISQEEWQQYFDFASMGDNWKRFDKDALKIGLYKKRSTTHKQMNWAMSVVEAIEKEKEKKEANQEIEKKLEAEQFNQPLKHFTLRVAWHDNAWDGHICKNPEANRYCSGYHSLLSERIRRNKEESMADEINHAGKSITDIDYLPPCYWSINLNGTKSTTVSHINPAAPKELEPVKEELSANAMFSWPFAISFNRSIKQQQAEGAYPPNLDKVRIPLFREKVKEKNSIAFFYAKFSNPFTEEERQYLVVGAALIMNKGQLLEFGPLSAIEAKRKKLAKNKNFPVQNWALQFKFDDALKVMMPYHEYLGKANSISDSALRQATLDKIKVAISEPELVHCFKYVAMDIDDDEAIYILNKMRQRLVDCKNDGVIDPSEIVKKIQTVDELSRHCWKHRGYFPGFVTLSELLLGRETKFQELHDSIKDSGIEEVDEKLLSLMENPKSDPAFKAFKNELFDLKETLEPRGISTEQLIKLSMLNLSKHQFERVLDGKIKDFDGYKHQVAYKDKTPIEDICNNPYLLVEEYLPEDGRIDDNTGEELDSPIELFKIDIAYFPDTRVMPRLDLQRETISNVSHKYRLRCLIINYLKQLEQKGDCFEEATELENALRQYPLFYQQDAELTLKTDILKQPISDRDAFFESDSKLKLVDANDTRYYYLNRIFEAEKTVGDKIHELLNQPPNGIRYRDLDGYLEKSTSLLDKNANFDKEDFASDRRNLYENVFKNRVYLLAGGPGSGKSHELLNILKELKGQGENYLLLTPTGKAALRLKADKEFPGIEASTIDKWLTEVKNGKFTRENIAKVNNLVVDEMSMVDILKFLEVMNHFQFSKPSFKRLILVGDPNQLPAIGYGKVLKDILYFLKSNIDYHKNYIELSGNYRSELSGNKVIELSQAFEEKGEPSEGIEPLLQFKSGDRQISEGFRITFFKDDAELKQKIDQEFDSLCKNRFDGSKQERLHLLLGLTKEGKFKKDSQPNLENFQILSPYLSGLSGTDGLNDYFQKTFKHSLELKLAKGYYKEADKIIRAKNYYHDEELLLSNGSIGLIQINDGEALYFQERDFKEIKLKSIRKAEQEFFDLAYAISIHKSQGSGFDHLFIIIPDRPGLLSKELIYTALTRCRKSVTLFVQNLPDKHGSKNLLDLARTRTFTDSRKTTLLLNQPFRYFSLEPEVGVFVQSRTELMIYHALKVKRDRLGRDKFDFYYEKYPTLPNGEELKIKCDFTILSNGKTWYWEHLGRLGNRVYERNWNKLKRPAYVSNGFESSLITSDELRGVSTEKIDAIVESIFNGDLSTEDNKNKYSKLHISLR